MPVWRERYTLHLKVFSDCHYLLKEGVVVDSKAKSVVARHHKNCSEHCSICNTTPFKDGNSTNSSSSNSSRPLQ